MKTGRSPDNKSNRCSLKTGPIGVKNSPKRTNRRNHKSTGCGDELSADKENKHFSFKETVRQCQEVPDKDTFLMEKSEGPEFHPAQALASSAKIKLQLFPINKETRIGLEKDGHNPYLELTLNGQKKISSVLKHLEKKWGSSSVAKGDPMLFPYNITENLSNCRRWTINDSDTKAGTVYAAVGSPAIFRLRYGWFYIHEPRSFGIPSTPIPYEPCVQAGGTEGGCNADLENLYNERDKVEVTSKECKAIDVGEAANEAVSQKMDNASVAPLDNEPSLSSSLQQSSLSWIDSLTNISIGGLLSEASLQGRLSIPDPKSFDSNAGKPSLSWVDSLTNISIGGLLSEASLQGRLSTLDQKSFDSNAGKQPSGSSQIISDSLDAFISAHINHPPVSRPSTEGLRTSILDAEETCHAFPLQKLSSMQTISGKEYSVECIQDVPSNSLKLSNADKVNDQDGLSQNPPSGKTWTDLLFSSHSNDGERSLGLSGIKWNESLGPFDLGMPAKLMGGDSVSTGGFVKS